MTDESHARKAPYQARLLAALPVYVSIVLPLVVSVALALILAGFPWLRFDRFLSLEGDHFFLQVLAKQFAEGSSWNANPLLGFPDAMRLAFFPSFDLGHRVLLSLVTSTVSDYVRAINIWYLVSVGMVAATTFTTLYLLNIQAWPACLGAVVFAVSPYAALRSGGHDYLALYWSVPLLAALPFYLFDLRRKAWWFLIGSLAGATGGLYYGFFGMFFFAIAGACLSIARLQVRYAVVAILVALLTLLLLVATGYGLETLAVLRGDYPQVGRVASEQIHYGLPIAAALKEFSFAPFFADRFQEYAQITQGTARLIPPSEQAGFPGPFLTAIILLAPAVTILGSVGMPRPKFLLEKEFASLQLCSALILAGLLFALQGGYGYLFNLLIASMIRAQVRIVPFLTFFALFSVLIVVGALLRSPNLGARACAVLLCVLTLLGTSPALFFVSKRQAAFLADAQVQANVASVDEVVARLRKAPVRAVLQLPILQWPEVAPQNRFEAYEHQLLYLRDQMQPSIMWSYGAHWLQPSFRYVRTLLALARESGHIGEAAAGLGFDGIVIEKRAFRGDEFAAIMMDWSKTEACRLYEDGLRVAFHLEKPCFGAKQWTVPSSFIFQSGRAELDLLLPGWHAPETDRVWSASKSVQLIVPITQDTKRLSFDIAVFTLGGLERPLRVLVDDELSLEIGAQMPRADGILRRTIEAPLPKNHNGRFVVVKFQTPEMTTPSQFGLSDPRLLGLALHSVQRM